MSAFRHVLSVAAAAALWGSAGVIGRLATDAGVAPISVAASRLAIAAMVLPLIAAAAARRRSAGLPVSPRRASPPAWAVVGTGVLLALYQGAFFGAVDRTGVTVATLVSLGCAPVLVALAGPLVGDARPDRRTWAGLLAALIGLVLLVGADLPKGAGAPAGVALALVAGCGYAAITLLGRTLRGADPVRVLVVAFPVGTVVLAPAAVELLGASVGPLTWWSLLYLGVLPTGVAYLLFFRGTAGLSAAIVSTITLLEPATAAALAALVLGERVGLVGMFGAGLVLAGVVVVSRPRQEQSVVPVPPAPVPPT